MRGGGDFSLECQVKVFKCVFFFKKKKTPQRIKETNQLETEKKSHSWNQQLLCSEVVLKKESDMAFIIYTKELPQGQRKKKNSCGAKWRPPLGRKNPDGLAVFSARWILAAGGAAITPAAESLHLAVPFSQQASKAAAVDGWNRREREKVLCQEKSVWSKESSVLLRGGVFFFFSLFSLPPRPQQDLLSEISEIHTEWKWTSVEWRKK